MAFGTLYRLLGMVVGSQILSLGGWVFAVGFECGVCVDKWFA